MLGGTAGTYGTERLMDMGWHPQRLPGCLGNSFCVSRMIQAESIPCWNILERLLCATSSWCSREWGPKPHQNKCTCQYAEGQALGRRPPISSRATLLLVQGHLVPHQTTSPGSLLHVPEPFGLSSGVPTQGVECNVTPQRKAVEKALPGHNWQQHLPSACCARLDGSRSAGRQVPSLPSHH